MYGEPMVSELSCVDEIPGKFRCADIYMPRLRGGLHSRRGNAGSPTCSKTAANHAEGLKKGELCF